MTMLEWTLGIGLVLPPPIMVICWLFLRFTLDPRVRSQLPEDKLYISHADLCLWGIGRAIMFGYAAIWPYASNKSKYIKKYYNSFDVYEFANGFEKFIAWIMSAALAIMLLSATTMTITDYFGITHLGIWDERPPN